MNRPFDASKDSIKLDLRHSSNSNLTHGTAVVVDPKSKQWTMNIDAFDATNPLIIVKSPANAFIGRYKVAIYLESTIDGKTEYALDEEPDIILLGNPWCEDDSVYMASEEERNEYVMMDVAAIWRGTTRYSSGMQ